MQRITVENFGPIKNLSLNIDRFSIFFGPQASGKSTLSKSIYYFKSLRDEIYEYIADHIQADRERILTFNNIIFKLSMNFKSLFGQTYLNNNYYLSFYYKDEVSLTLKRKNSREINFVFSKPILLEIERIINFVNAYKEQSSREKRQRENLRSIIGFQHRGFLKKIREMLNDLFADTRELLYIPAGRSLISTLSNKLYLLFQISEYDRNVDYLIREFSKKIMDTRDYFDRNLNELISEKPGSIEDNAYKKKYYMLVDILRSILGGDYRFIDGKDRLYLNNKSYIPLNIASSGQQESVWILYLILYYYLEEKECFIVIEEPEAHLFPKAQRDVLRAIALFSNVGNNQCIVTTHSPYFVSSMNNLLYSKHLNNLYGAIHNTIAPEYWIDPRHVAALFLANGKVENMLDEETQLLISRYLDSVSDLNSDEFEELYQIELDNKYADDDESNIYEQLGDINSDNK